MSSREADADTQQAIQGIVDALSIAICRPVLVDDPSLALLAYSRQSGEIDEVRANAILSRGVPPAVREALLAQGIARATDVIHTSPDAALGMAERACMPVRAEDALVAYIWILDPETTLGDDDLDQVRRASHQLERFSGVRESAGFQTRPASCGDWFRRAPGNGLRRRPNSASAGSSWRTRGSSACWQARATRASRLPSRVRSSTACR